MATTCTKRLNMLNYARKSVLCIGSLDVPAKPFEDCDTTLVKVDLNEAIRHYNDARAILIAEPQDRMGIVRGYLTTLKTSTKEYGLSIFAIVTNNVHYGLFSKLWTELDMGVLPRIYLFNSLARAAHDIFVCDPGPPLGNAKIRTSGFRLSREKKQLLRRAFYDCDRIYLRSLEGGRNSQNVFSVDAWLKRSEVGSKALAIFH